MKNIKGIVPMFAPFIILMVFGYPVYRFLEWMAEGGFGGIERVIAFLYVLEVIARWIHHAADRLGYGWVFNPEGKANDR